MPSAWSRRRLWRQRRKSYIFSLLTLIFVLVLFLYHHDSWWISNQPGSQLTSTDPASRKAANPLLPAQASFWRVLYQIILDNDPACDKPPELVVPHKLDVGFDPSHPHPRPDLLWMELADIKRMREAHSNFVKSISTETPGLVYKEGSRGIVMTAGFIQLPVLVISIRMLRRTQSSLPVEVFLAELSDYDPVICETVLPSLNAKCLIFSDIFDAANSGVALDKFQFKIMSILFSSFESVLLLDSDAFPIEDPDIIFNNEPFTSTGMITWPDFWAASESPYFFQIAGLDFPSPMHTKPSTESGEIMINKSKHKLSLLLATYYNYYGPEYYYILHSQGAPGQGDKETFGWAAKALNESLYTVHAPVIALGHLDSTGSFFGSAMAQHDPVSDFHRISQKHSTNDEDIATDFGAAQTQGPPPSLLNSSSSSIQDEVKIFFIHANFPKFDPSTIFSSRKLGDPGPTRDSNGTSVRSWMNETAVVQLFGFDVERRFWEEIRHVACEHEMDFGCWKLKFGICERMRKYWDDVFQ